MPYELSFLYSLAFTLFVEAGVVLLAGSRVAGKKISFFVLLVAGTLPTALTLPYVWFVLPYFLSDRLYLSVAETFAVVVEGFVIAGIVHIRVRRALLLSLLANGVSCGLGMLILWRFLK